MNTTKVTSVGNFCPNQDCAQYGEIASGNIIKYGRSNQGRQRYRCSCCKKAFNENTGTLFYRRRKSSAEILETLSLLSKGTSISAIKRAKGYKEDTINSWLLEAAEHMEMVSEALMH